MDRIAQFEKVSHKQFTRDWLDKFPVSEAEKDIPALEIVEKISDIYDSVILPKRGTKGSAAYDLFLPITIQLKPGTSVFVPTGIRSRINEGWCLLIMPRSGQGIKFKLRLANTIGLIDSDYYNSSNEGHIMVKIENEGDKNLTVEYGKACAQMLFVPYGITVDDNVEEERDGGFGSTDK